MVDPNRKINHLTDDDVKYLNECENEFKDRFTENDEEFMALFNTPPSEPPIVTPWMVRSGNTGPSNYRGQQQHHHHHQRSGNYNQRPYHHHRSNHHRGGRGRGGGNYNRNYRYNDNSDDNNRRGMKRPHDYNDDRSDHNDRKRDYN